jgi:hypothetical protein
VVVAAEQLEDRTMLSLSLGARHEHAQQTSGWAADIGAASHEATDPARALRLLKRSAPGRSINHPISVGTVAAGENPSFPGTVGKKSPKSFYQLEVAPQEAVHAGLSVLSGAAVFSILNSSQGIIASLSLSGSATDTWAFGVGTYYIRVSTAGKAKALFQLSFRATAQTATSLDALPHPSVFGETVTFIASVHALAPASSPPVGTLTFMDGSVMLGTRALDGRGTATWSTSALSVGTHAITASYTGNGNFDTSTSSTLSQTVNQGSSATNVSANASTAVYGRPLTFTVTASAIAPGSGIPTGMVALSAVASDGSSWRAVGTLDPTAGATFTAPALGAGSYSITAQYLGDANFQASASPTATTTVNPAGTSVQLTSAANQDGSPAPSEFGQAVAFTALVRAAGPGSGPLGGTVTFMDGSNTLGTSTLESSGTVTWSTSALSVGTHAVTAVYSGYGSFAPSSSAALSQVVDQAITTPNVSVSADSGVSGQALTFTVSVSVISPGAGTPTGLVSLSVQGADGSNWFGAGPLDGTATAKFTPPALAPGTYTFTASYLGDSNFTASAFASGTTTVGPAYSTVVLSSSASPAVWQASVTFTATVAPVPPGAGTPTGAVQFQIDGVNFGAPVLLVNGAATSGSINSLTAGSHTITASYLGDPNFRPSTAPLLSLSVQETQQQFEAALKSKIEDGVTQFARDAAVVEGILPTAQWLAIDGALLVVTSDVKSHNDVQALQDIQTMGSFLLVEAIDVWSHGGFWWQALLGYSKVVTDLQNLGALKEISYTFIAYIAAKISSGARSTPANWATGGLLGTPSTTNINVNNLSSQNLAMLTGYSTSDRSYVSDRLASLNAQEGVIASGDAFHQEAQVFNPYAPIIDNKQPNSDVSTDTP